MRIAVCEDEVYHIEILTGIISKWGKSRNLRTEVFTFSNAESFLAQWSDECPFDIVFIDIHMGKMSGIELAEAIRKTDPNILLVFVTSIREFVFRGYEVNALHYLLKPIRAGDCFSVLDKARKIVEGFMSEAFIFQNNDERISIPVNKIFYFESVRHYMNVHSETGSYRFREKISMVEERVPKPQFCRCHRSIIVNVYHVHLINKTAVQLNDEVMTVLPVSQTYWPLLNQSFIAYHGRK